MGKKSNKKAENEKVISREVITVTELIAQLCEKNGLVPTDTYAVKKELTKYGASAKIHYTRWAVNAEGERCLVVLNETQDDIHDYSNYEKVYQRIRTVKSA